MKKTYKSRMFAIAKQLNNPKIKCVSDEINGKTFSLCLMASDNLNEKRIVRHLSPYYPPKELIAFIEGYLRCQSDYCVY